MLNEGYTLYKSLERCGIVPPQRHPDIKKTGKKNGLIVGINHEGNVASIEFRSAIEMAKLWKISDGIKNSFPCMTLSLGLLNLEVIPEKDIKTITSNKDIKRLERIWQEYGLNKKLKRRNGNEVKQTMIADWKSVIHKLQERKEDVDNIGKEAEAYKVLLLRMLKYNYEDSDRDIANAITEHIFSNLENGLLKFEEVKDFLLLEEPGSFIFFDIYEYEKYETRVASSRIADFVSDCLLQQERITEADVDNKENSTSALTGKPNAKIGDKFPNPNLNFIGITNLFSVDRNTPCLRRYGQISTKLFPVDTDEANAIQDSLVWITDDERRGKTWYPLEKKEFLIVYLSSKPDINVNKAHLLGGVTKNGFSENSYEAISSVAIEALKGSKLIKANDLIRLFALRKADLGRTQVSLQRIYAISDLVKADENWKEAAKNFPNISLPFFRKEIERITAKQENISTIIKNFLTDDKSKLINLTPKCPFPVDLVRLTQKQWIRGGEDFSSVAGCSLGDIYDVFFANENEKKYLVENLLSKTLQRTKALLIGIANADHKKELIREQKKYHSEKRFIVLRTISAFAIYLNKLGITKENYMKDTFFYVGRFLSLIDTLHFEYCKNVRGGSIPPQLLGNSHLQIALDNPVSAIDMLSRRISVYHAWAKKEQGENIRAAKWAVRELGKTSNLLAEKNLPLSTNDVERTQILLGYLSRSESNTEFNSVNNMEEHNDNN
ncbi:MAG: hypothetical protein ACYC49_10425 [Ignavibacteriaceae bacterium]